MQHSHPRNAVWAREAVRFVVAVRPAVARALTGLAAGAAALAMAGSVEAQPVPRDQVDPELMFLEERAEHLLFWAEDRGAGHRIYARRVGANGIAVPSASRGEWEATRTRIADRVGDQRWPAAAEGLLVYSERVPGKSDYDIYAQRLFDNGRPNGYPVLLVEEPADQKHPDVVTLPRTNGFDYFVAWSDDSQDRGDVLGQRVNFALRGGRGQPFRIATGPGTSEDPSVNRDPIDPEQLLVVYTDDRNGVQDIYGVRLAGNGLPRGGATAAPFPIVQSNYDDFAPTLLANLDEVGGRLEAKHLLVWTRNHVTELGNIMSLRLDSNGLPKGRPYPVAAGLQVQAWPTAGLRRVYDRRGRREPDEWLVGWMEDARGTFDVVGSRVGLYGQILGTPRPLATD